MRFHVYSSMELTTPRSKTVGMAWTTYHLLGLGFAFVVAWTTYLLGLGLAFVVTRHAGTIPALHYFYFSLRVLASSEGGWCSNMGVAT